MLSNNKASQRYCDSVQHTHSLSPAHTLPQSPLHKSRTKAAGVERRSRELEVSLLQLSS